MSSFPTAEVALAVSLATAGWQLLRYTLEGGRVRVRMLPGLHDDYALVSADSWESLGKTSEERGGWTVEVAILEIENKGRTAVTVSNPSMDLGRTNLRRFDRHTIIPQPVKSGAASVERAVRLDPFDSAFFVFDVWQVLAAIGPELRSRPLRLRGSIRVAGKRFVKRSRWRKGWTVRPNQLAFISSGCEIGLAAYRSMWRQTHGGMMADMRISCMNIASVVRDRFAGASRAPSMEEIEEIIEEHSLTETIGSSILAFNMEKDLRPYFKDVAK